MGKKLQIIIMGWEWDRIFEGIKTRLPNKVIFICPKEEIDFTKKTNLLCKNIIKKIRSLVDFEIYSANFEDYLDCLETLNKAILNSKQDYKDIEINISTGGKLILYTAILVAQYNKCKLFYGIPKKYNIPKEKFYSEGIKKWVEIPVFDLKNSLQISPFEFKILNLSKKELTLTELVKKIDKDLKNIYDERKYKMKVLYHIKKLESKKLIKSKIKNGKKIIILTKTGDFLIETCQ